MRSAWSRMPIARRLTAAQKKQVAARHDWTCTTCREVVDETFAIDHILPLWEGGTDAFDNLQLLCAQCHAKKTYDETVRRAERARRLKQTAPSTTASCMCNGCGVVFSPFFRHRCA